MRKYTNNEEEYDIAKSMLSVTNLKSFKNSMKNNTLYESFAEIMGDDKSSMIKLEGQPKSDEEKKFREIVSPKTEFNEFVVYPNANNAEWSGTFYDNKLEWTFSLGEPNGVYISGEMVKVTDDVLETIKKLVGYYDTWSSEWANKIMDEYSKNDNLPNNE